MQSRKMVARMQAASNQEGQIYLRTSSNTGHGMGTPVSTRLVEQVDVMAFILKQLEVEYKE
jgi:prolyl oligopeptidase